MHGATLNRNRTAFCVLTTLLFLCGVPCCNRGKSNEAGADSVVPSWCRGDCRLLCESSGRDSRQADFCGLAAHDSLREFAARDGGDAPPQQDILPDLPYEVRSVLDINMTQVDADSAPDGSAVEISLVQDGGAETPQAVPPPWSDWLLSGGGTKGEHVAAVGIGQSDVIVVAGPTYSSEFHLAGASLKFSESGTQDLFVARLDPSGELVWLRGLADDSKAVLKGVAVDPMGNAYLGGQFGTKTMSAGDQTLFNSTYGRDIVGFPSHRDVFLIKLGPAGEVLWAKSFGATLSEYLSTLRTGPDGDIWIAGWWQGSEIDFGGGPLGSKGRGGYVARMSPQGDHKWSIGLADDDASVVPSSIALGSEGSIAVAGYYSMLTDGALNLGPAAFDGSGSRDAFVAQFASDGSFLWVVSIAGEDWDFASRVLAGDSGSLTVVVYTESPKIDLGNGQIWTAMKPTDSEPAFVLVVKYDALGHVEWFRSLGIGSGGGVSDAVALAGGDVMVVGWASGPYLSLDGVLLATGVFGEPFAMRLSPSGKIKCAQIAFGGSGSATSLAAAPEGGVVIGGGYKDELTMGDTTVEAITWATDAFVASVAAPIWCP